MEIINVKISDLNAAAYNPREQSEESRAGLIASIKKFGFVDPIIVNKKNNTIIGGHQRVEAASSLGFNELPCVYVDMDDVEEKALNVVLNSQEISGNYTDDLQNLLQEIKLDLPEYEDLNLNLIEISNLDKIEETDIDISEDDKKYRLEVTFPNEMEMMDIHDDLTSRGYISRVK